MPTCICMSMMCTCISDFFLFSTEAICFYTNVLIDGCKLSYTTTSALLLAPILVIVSQCPKPLCTIWTNSPETARKPIDWARQGSCRPAVALCCSLNTSYAAEISEVFSHPTGLNRMWPSSLSSAKFLHTCISCVGTCSSTLIDFGGFLAPALLGTCSLTLIDCSGFLAPVLLCSVFYLYEKNLN